MSVIDQLENLITRVDGLIEASTFLLVDGLLETLRGILTIILHQLYIQEITCILWPNPPEEQIVFAPIKLGDNQEIIPLTTAELYDAYELMRECLPTGVENCVDGLEISLATLFKQLETAQTTLPAKLALEQALWRRLISEINASSLKTQYVAFYEAAGAEATLIDKVLSSSENDADIELPVFGTLELVENAPTLLFVARLMGIEDKLAEVPPISQIETDFLTGESLGIKSLLQYLYTVGQLNEQKIRNLLESYEAKIQATLGLRIQGDIEIGGIDEQIVRNNQLLLEKVENVQTIYSIVDSFRVRHHYRIGAEYLANWFNNYFSISLLSPELPTIYDKFRFVMNNIQINRTTAAFAGIDDSFGYTEDHIIHDRLDSFTNTNFRASRKPIKWQLFLHELCHAFINSGGFGAVGTSPLFGGSGTTNEMSSAMYEQMNGIVRCSGTQVCVKILVMRLVVLLEQKLLQTMCRMVL